MALPNSSRLGPYEIISTLGAGGMGEVYRATDCNLKRSVAIKVLPAPVAGDLDRLARFQREAEVLAALNHPNIAAIYGLEKTYDFTALVMELVEGEDLSQRIARGALPIDEALPIAKQIADALEAAHEQGIIHRDLKPANIKVRPDGTVKVLDFGLAKAIDPAGVSNANAMNSPTLSIHATQAGIILGTAAYMSPEQARGKAVDRRTDIWACGCVLFEMLTGTRAFPGDDATDTIVSVVSKEPDWSALPAGVPAGIRRLLRRCLEKDPKRRLDSASAVRLEIDDAGSVAPIDSVPTVQARRSRRSSLLLAIATFVVGGLIVGGAMWSFARSTRERSTAPVVRFGLHDSDKVLISRVEGDMALSPDGQTLAFVGTSEGVARIWLRRLGEQEGHPLPGTEDVQGLTWSADGRSVAFGTSRLIKRALIGGGTAEVVSGGRVGTTSRFAWGPDGTLVFSDTRGLWRVPANGGTAVIAARDAGVTYQWPSFLPDGRHFLVGASSADAAKTGTFVLSLDDSSKTRLLALPTPARYAMGRLLYVRDRTLYAQPFDASRLELTGEAVALAPNVAPTFASSNQGTMAVLPLGPADQSDITQLVWMSRAGRVEKRFEEAGGARRPSLSPDGRRVAANLRSGIWVIDLARGIQSRVALDIVGNGAVWSPDNQRLIFNRSNYQSKGKDAMFETLVANIGSETMVSEPVNQHAHPTDMSSDGKVLFYEGGEDAYEIWIQDLTGDRKTVAYSPTPAIETQGVLSPDGHWLAYTSDLSGRFEIYVQSFPKPGVRVQVSPGGGHSARWRRDGKELFYVTPDGTLTAVPVRAAQPPEFGAPVALFQFNSASQGSVPRLMPEYDVTSDGQRFIVSTVVRRNDASIHVLLNWPALLTK